MPPVKSSSMARTAQWGAMKVSSLVWHLSVFHLMVPTKDLAEGSFKVFPVSRKHRVIGICLESIVHNKKNYWLPSNPFGRNFYFRCKITDSDFPEQKERRGSREKDFGR